MIAKPDTLYVLSHPLYHTRTFMTEHHRRVGLIPVIAEVYIGAADARGDKAHENLVFPWAFHLNRFDAERAALLPQNCRLDLVPMHAGVKFTPSS